MDEESIELTEKDSGSERRAHVGQIIQVSLPENPTTGYRWQPDIDTSALRLAGDDYSGEAEPRGAPGRRVMRFVPLRPGTTSLRVVKRRSWGQQAAGEFSVVLGVVEHE